MADTKPPHNGAGDHFIEWLLMIGKTAALHKVTLPVRNDVKLNPGLPVASPEEAVKRALTIDYIAMMAEKEATVKKFTAIIQGKK